MWCGDAQGACRPPQQSQPATAKSSDTGVSGPSTACVRHTCMRRFLSTRQTFRGNDETCSRKHQKHIYENVGVLTYHFSDFRETETENLHKRICFLYFWSPFS